MPNQPRIRLVCANCSAAMQVPTNAAYRPHKCPKCGSPLAAPGLCPRTLRPLAGYERWPAFWQGMAMGAASGALVLVVGLLAAGAWKVWGQ